MQQSISGIILADYCDKWKLQRQTTTQIFHHLGVGKDVLGRRINMEADTLVHLLRGKQQIDIQMYIHTATCRVLISLLFGDGHHYESEEIMDVLQSVKGSQTNSQIINRYLFIKWIKFFPFFRKMMADLVSVENHITVILQRMIGNSISCESTAKSFVGAYRTERKKNPNIDNRLFQIINDLVKAGTDSTPQTLSWAIYFMIANPLVKEKVQQEIDDVVGRSGQADLPRQDSLPYVKATLHETLRMARTAPITIPHKAMKDTTVGGYFIPKRTLVNSSFNLSPIIDNLSFTRYITS